MPFSVHTMHLAASALRLDASSWWFRQALEGSPTEGKIVKTTMTGYVHADMGVAERICTYLYSGGAQTATNESLRVGERLLGSLRTSQGAVTRYSQPVGPALRVLSDACPPC